MDSDAALSRIAVQALEPGGCLIEVRLDRVPTEGTELALQGTVREDFTGVGRVFISTDVGESIRVPLTRKFQGVEAPRREYNFTLSQGSTLLAVGLVDATGPSAELELEIPDVVHVSGEIASTMRGPIPDLALSVSSEGMRMDELVRTDAAGRFQFDFPARGPIHIRPQWNDGWVRERLWPRALLTPPIDPAVAAASYMVEEALLRISESPPSPLLGHVEVEIERRTDAGEGSGVLASIALGELASNDLHLPPGRYVFGLSLGLDDDHTLEVTLLDGEVRDVVLDCSQVAVIGLDVFPSDPEHSMVVVRVRDGLGDIVDFTGFNRVRGDSVSYREIVEPGIYSVELELRSRDARASDEPLDLWQGEIEALPGARGPLRVYLR